MGEVVVEMAVKRLMKLMVVMCEVEVGAERHLVVGQPR